LCLILLTSITLFSACAVQQVNAPVKVPDDYTVDNYSDGKMLPDANLYSISYENMNSESLVINFDFMQGSAIEDSNQRSAYCVPEYNITLLENPSRLSITFPSLKYMDYERKLGTNKPNYQNLLGYFSYDYNGRNIFYEFNTAIAFRAEQNENRLIVRIMPLSNENTADINYFVTANAYEEYISNTFESDTLSPTLTRENGGAILISKPFANKNAARSFYNTLVEAHPAYSKTFEVIAMHRGQLPIYNPEKDSIDISDVFPALIENAPTRLPSVLSNGQYLCDAPNGSILYCKRSTNSDSDFFTLHVKTQKGIENIDFEFENIESAKYSPNSKMLAVLESSSTGSHLYIFSTKIGKLIADLSDSGLGKRISDFIWSEYSTAIYAICGTETVQLKMYDFTMPEGNRTSIVYGGYVDESSLAMQNGLLYFVCSDETGATVYNIRPDGGARRAQFSGSSFAFSDDGKSIAVTTAGVFMLPNSKNNLSVYDVETKESVLVTEEFDVFDFVWGKDNVLYYIQNKQGSTETEEGVSIYEYPYVLYAFDLETKQSTIVCELKSSNIVISSRYENPLLWYVDDLLFATFELVG
ncbi:MAG: hypothetical protein GX802_07420, partial [Clostridiales bacterium]|nr:hypothetical protein [Clostridiales bacterium]